MIFLFVIPMLAGFGNYVVPLMIGAPDMAFPRINALSFWMLPLGGILLLARASSPAAPRRPAGRATAPLAQDRQYSGIGHRTCGSWPCVLIGTSSILGAINFLVTIFKMRAPGMTLFRMPILVWTMLVTSVLVADGDAGPHQRPDHAVHRPQLRRPLLRPGDRRQRDPLAERLLVLLAPGRLRHDPAGDGHRSARSCRSSAASRSSATRRSSSRRPASAPWASRSGPTTCSRPARSTCRSSAS